MAVANKKKVLEILNSFYLKIAKIESEKRKLAAIIQAEEDQAKIKKAQNQLKNL